MFFLWACCFTLLVLYLVLYLVLSLLLKETTETDVTAHRSGVDVGSVA